MVGGCTKSRCVHTNTIWSAKPESNSKVQRFSIALITRFAEKFTNACDRNLHTGRLEKWKSERKIDGRIEDTTKKETTGSFDTMLLAVFGSGGNVFLISSVKLA